MSHVVEINDVAALGEQRLLWNALLPQTRGGSFFQSCAWLEIYWRHFGEQQKLRVLIVYSESGPVGVLPLVVRADETRFGTIRRLTYPLHGWGGFYGPIGPNPTGTLLAGFRHIASTPRDWDLVDLPWIARDQTDCGRTPRALAQVGLPTHELPYEESSQVDCAQTWQSYWASRKSHWRTNVRRTEKKLHALGKVKYVRYRPEGALYGDDDPRWDLWRDCLRLAESSWQAKSTTGTTLSHAQVRDFLTDAHEVAAHEGALDMNLLYIDDRPVAFAYNYHRDGNVFGLRSGYDRAPGNKGSGSMLLRHAFEDSMTRGDTLYDLGPGYLEAKRQWTTHLASSHRYLHYPKTTGRAQLVRVGQWIKRWRTSGKQAST